jgi:hypothetical protein
MAMPYAGGGVVGVRLGDIPIEIRRRYGRHLYERAASDGDLELAMRINRAVERPSDRVYWLPRMKVLEIREAQRW